MMEVILINTNGSLCQLQSGYFPEEGLLQENSLRRHRIAAPVLKEALRTPDQNCFPSAWPFPESFESNSLGCVTDLRKSYTGLAAIIKLKFHLDPYSRCMFAFCNRRRTLIKILQWDGSGFWIPVKIGSMTLLNFLKSL